MCAHASSECMSGESLCISESICSKGKNLSMNVSVSVLYVILQVSCPSQTCPLSIR